MVTMVERVAEELHARTPLDSRWSLIAARAAIEAMREPTGKMVNAGVSIWGAPSDDEVEANIANEYKAMIDEALKEVE